jgi:hypothetical protein
MKKKLSSLLLCILTAFVFAACGNNSVATVNGVEITRDQYEEYVNYMVSYYGEMYTSYGIDFSMTDDMAASLQTSSIDALVYMEEIKQACAEVDCTPTDDEIEEYIYANLGVTEEADYKEYLSSIESAYGISEDMVVDLIAIGLYEEKLADYLEEEKGITFSEEDAQALYEADPESYDNRTISYILIQPDDTDATTDDEGYTVYSDEAWADAKAEAQEVIDALDDGGDFAELAAEYSDDSSTASSGGSISESFTAADSSYVEEFTEAAFALTKAGDYTEKPVKSSDFGYFVIRCDGLQDADNDFDDLIASIVAENVDSLKYDAFTTYMEEFEESCDIVYYYGENADSDEDEAAE